MEQCIENFKKSINRINTDRISTNLIEDIKIKYKGSTKALNKISSISIQNYNTMIITAFDIKTLPIIKNAILNSKLNLSCHIKEELLIVRIPNITKERRLELIKVIKNEAETSKIIIRNIRRAAKDNIKKLLKNKDINLDKERNYQKNIQKLTDLWISRINSILEKKEKKLLQ